MRISIYSQLELYSKSSFITFVTPCVYWTHFSTCDIQLEIQNCAKVFMKLHLIFFSKNSLHLVDSEAFFRSNKILKNILFEMIPKLKKQRFKKIACIRFYFQKFVDNTKQCFAFIPKANFPAHNFNFYWWWDGIKSRLSF